MFTQNAAQQKASNSGNRCDEMRHASSYLPSPRNRGEKVKTARSLMR
jgi:hypothetical protein